MSLWVPPEDHEPGVSINEQVYRLVGHDDLLAGRFLGD